MTVTNDPNNPKITVDDDADWFVSVPKGSSTRMTWSLKGPPDYRFASGIPNGIEFDTSSVGCSPVQSDPRKFQCTIADLNTITTVYKYTINVVPRPGSSVPTVPALDPWVIAE